MLSEYLQDMLLFKVLILLLVPYGLLVVSTVWLLLKYDCGKEILAVSAGVSCICFMLIMGMALMHVYSLEKLKIKDLKDEKNPPSACSTACYPSGGSRAVVRYKRSVSFSHT